MQISILWILSGVFFCGWFSAKIQMHKYIRKILNKNGELLNENKTDEKSLGIYEGRYQVLSELLDLMK